MKSGCTGISMLLTVLLVLFGIGALACHPWASTEEWNKVTLPTGCDLSSISPQARWIVYGCENDLWLAPFPSLQGATRIAQDDATVRWERQTVWMPDETALLIESSPIGPEFELGTIWSVKTDSPLTKTKLFTYLSRGDLVWWAPDRSALLTLSMGGEVRLVGPDGSDRTLPIHGLIMRTPAIAWSPDSQHVAYIMDYSPPTLKSGVLNLTTLQSTVVYTDVGVPEWFPDGKTVALFQWNRIDAVGADGSGLQGSINIPKGFTTEGSVAWSRDGSRLAVYLRNDGPDYKPVAIGIVDWRKMAISAFEVDPNVRKILTWTSDENSFIVLAHEDDGIEVLRKIPTAR